MDNNLYQNNSFITCPNCKNNIVYGSPFCNYCGYQFKYTPEPISQQYIKTKDSPLSIISAVISLFGIFSSWALSILGFIIAVIDLAVCQVSNNENQKHSCSWFSVVVFLIYIFLAFIL